MLVDLEVKLTNDGLLRLAELREQTSDLADADTLYSQAADGGDAFALHRLVGLREAAGDSADTATTALQAGPVIQRRT